MSSLGRVAAVYLGIPVVLAAPLLALVVLSPASQSCIPTGGPLEDRAEIPAEYGAMVNDAATTHGVSARWLAAVITAESDWNPRARSDKGAMGLGQLMPGTARALGVTDPWDPRQSIDGAARYLADQYRTFGTWQLAVAAYNAGPHAVMRYGGIPPFAETRAYVPKVTALAEQYGSDDAAAVILCLPDATRDGPIITDGVACPVGRPHHFTDTWGAPRSGGRTHKGVDIFADIGIPIYAYQGGTVRLSSSTLGGIALWITSDTGDRYYYAHLSGYAPAMTTGTRVVTGQLIGYNGNTGNARYTPPHLHWEVHPAGRPAVNPTPHARAACE